MESKRCLFCDQVVPIRPKGEYDWFLGCHCAPGSFYGLRRDDYDAFDKLSYNEKRAKFPIISAYIRELTDCEEAVALSFDDLQKIEQSPRLPATIEEKGRRLLQFLYRHSREPGEAVIIHRLPSSYNLTYSPNLQEMVYIIEKLKEEGSIERTGTTFRLTEKGWKEAKHSMSGKKLKPCCVLMPAIEEQRKTWTLHVLPKIEQCGYFPQMPDNSDDVRYGDQMIRLISESKLLIADLTGHPAEVYFGGGIALGLDIPVIWTVHRTDADRLSVNSERIRPFVWEEPDEVAAMVQQRLNG
ncbi:hypothetical protein ABEV74_22470 [Paenibacillus cisolokensis]|uniref:hypothetical protein n=1 Tax=Paenibacillus cisolokensis TaxID=1658519 RepID=UPI003D28F43A